jgi:carbon starvation protein CstA
MGDEKTTIAGVEIPSTDPVFLAIVTVHILLGMACVLVGAVAMLSTKAPGRHPTCGTLYYSTIVAAVATASALSFMRWAANYHLFILGVLTFAAAYVGREAHRRRWSNWTSIHIVGMGSSYILLLTAFYVDNGKQLPLWKDLPPWTYWTLPALIGVPLIVWALLRHPAARRSWPAH